MFLDMVMHKPNFIAKSYYYVQLQNLKIIFNACEGVDSKTTVFSLVPYGFDHDVVDQSTKFGTVTP